MKKVTKAATYLCTLVMLMMVSFSMSADNSLIGKWLQKVDEQGVNIITTYDFRANGTMEQYMDMETTTNPHMKMVVDGVCDYTYTNNTITFKFDPKDFNFRTFEVDGLDETTKAGIIEQTKNSMSAMEQKITNVKINGNTLTGTFNGQELVLTRM